jgi:hypothetical protein
MVIQWSVPVVSAQPVSAHFANLPKVAKANLCGVTRRDTARIALQPTTKQRSQRELFEKERGLIDVKATNYIKKRAQYINKGFFAVCELFKIKALVICS